jgi:hypothetical protein
MVSLAIKDRELRNKLWLSLNQSVAPSGMRITTLNGAEESKWRDKWVNSERRESWKKNAGRYCVLHTLEVVGELAEATDAYFAKKLGENINLNDKIEEGLTRFRTSTLSLAVSGMHDSPDHIVVYRYIIAPAMNVSGSDPNVGAPSHKVHGYYNFTERNYGKIAEYVSNSFDMRDLFESFFIFFGNISQNQFDGISHKEFPKLLFTIDDLDLAIKRFPSLYGSIIEPGSSGDDFKSRFGKYLDLTLKEEDVDLDARNSLKEWYLGKSKLNFCQLKNFCFKLDVFMKTTSKLIPEVIGYLVVINNVKNSKALFLSKIFLPMYLKKHNYIQY